MDFNELLGKKIGKKDNVLEELNVLALNIQVLNQSLATSNMGDDPVLRKKITQVVDHINYLYGNITKKEKNIDKNIDEGFESIAKFFKNVEKRIEVIAQLANQLYQIHQVELIRMEDNIDALEKIVSNNKGVWQKLNLIKLDMLKKPKDDKYKIFSKDLISGDIKKTEAKSMDSLRKEADKLMKKIN